VIAADSKEGDGYSNKYVNKLEVFGRPEWSICWGGAGDAPMVDKFSDKFKQSLSSVRNYDRNDIEAIADSCFGPFQHHGMAQEVSASDDTNRQ
jgi:hypothetical protein